MKLKKKENDKYKLTVSQKELNTLSLLVGRASHVDLKVSADDWGITNYNTDDETMEMYNLLHSNMK